MGGSSASCQVSFRVETQSLRPHQQGYFVLCGHSICFGLVWFLNWYMELLSFLLTKAWFENIKDNSSFKSNFFSSKRFRETSWETLFRPNLLLSTYINTKSWLFHRKGIYYQYSIRFHLYPLSWSTINIRFLCNWNTRFQPSLPIN